MKIFKKYAEHLDALLDEIEWGNRLAGREQQVDDSLNGEAAQVLRSLASPIRIRKAGAFFTSAELANLSIRPLTTVPGLISHPVYDPTCGAGDLLLRWAEALPVTPNLKATLDIWGSLIVGHDLCDEFLAAARRRLVLKAIARGARLKGGRVLKVDSLFRGLQKGDARRQTFGNDVQTVVMNPPFNLVTAPTECSWSSGKVSLAAILFDSCIRQAGSETRIVAILPDVLRSGSRYANWRAEVASRFEVRRIQSYGRFDSHADIDVFILEGTVVARNLKSVKWWPSRKSTLHGSVSDRFDVSVGAVVPHRDPHLGPWVPFITSRNLGPWTETTKVTTRRRFKGTKVQPPFVAVRRTSGPRDRERAIGAIILGSEPVAVENHLIVLRPHDHKLASCNAIMKTLRNPRTNSWLNDRIRCRHLTVGIMSELPIWEKAG
jgi:hypothetical protein